MTKENAIKLFNDKQIRTHWDDEQQKWYFSIVDVVGALSESVDPQSYWRKLKQRLKEEGNETVTNCHGLKMKAAEWEKRGVQKGQEYAILTDEITKAWSGYSTKQYKNLKDLKKENLRDHMTNLELVLNMLAEATTSEISKEKHPKSFEDSKRIAKQGGTIAGNTRREIEEKTGKKVVTSQNAKQLDKGKNENKQID